MVKLIVLALAIAGCSSGPTEVTLSGTVLDPDVFGALRAMGKTGQEAFIAAAQAGLVVYADVRPSVKSAPSAADGSFTLKVPANSLIDLAIDGTTTYEPTYTMDEVQTGTVDLMGVPAHACGKANSAPAAVAAALTTDIDALTAQGICMYGTLAPNPPPNIDPAGGTSITADAGFDIYSLVPNMMGPPTATKASSSMMGLYGIVKSGLTAATDITIQATDPVTTAPRPYIYSPFKCTLKPGFVTFSGQFPN